MDYLKKVTVLKQTVLGYGVGGKQVSAIARLECENGVADFYLSVINLATVTQGEYYAFLCDQTQSLFTFALGKRPISYSTHLLQPPLIENGFCVGLCFVLDNLPTLFCFAKTDDCNLDQTFLRRKIADHFLSEHKHSVNTPCPIPDKQPAIETPIVCVPQSYDDLAVATENYFETDDKIKIKLEEIKEFDNERLSNKNELLNSRNQKEEIKSQACASCLQNETDFCLGKGEQEQPYYLTVKSWLDKIFTTFESEKPLCDLVPNSKWVKINYSPKQYYVVGLVGKDLPKYICYGVPDNYSPSPPKEFDGFCVFLPLDTNAPEGKGYWIMFQDCFTGRCALPDLQSLLQ